MFSTLGRAKAIIVTPQTEWPAIARAPQSHGSLLIGYIAIFALIPPLAHLAGGTLVGGYVPLASGLAGAAIAYVLSVILVYVVALLIDVLAPTFGGTKNYANALRLTAYSFTPVWLAGIFLVVPGASFLTLLGLYGFYLMWTGVAAMMQAPDKKALSYTAVVVAWALALQIVIGVTLAIVFAI
jgi:hypothetical protein